MWESITNSPVIDVLDILIVAWLLYRLLRFVRHTRAVQMVLGLAILLNQKIRGITIFRTTFYLPSIVSGVATAILWIYIFNPNFGPLNTFLKAANNFFDSTVIR